MRRTLVTLLVALFILNGSTVTGAKVPVATLLEDTFTAGNGIDIDARAMDSGDSWTFAQGTFTEGSCLGSGAIEIQSNQAAQGGADFCVYASDAGAADVVFTLDMVIPNAANYLNCASVRVTDINNFYLVCIERDAG